MTVMAMKIAVTSFLFTMRIKHKRQIVFFAVGGCGGIINVMTSPVPFLSLRTEKMDPPDSFEPFDDQTIPYNTNCR